MSSLPLSTWDVTQEVQIRKGDTDREKAKPKTVMENFDAIVKKLGSKPALHQKRLVSVRTLSRYSFSRLE